MPRLSLAPDRAKTKLIRVLIVDDEPLARRRIRTLLKGMREMEVVGECANGSEAVQAIREQSPDLLFLDVQMPETDGFSVLEALGDDRPPVVIFVTAFDQYAVRAFEVHALDYLLKPFDQQRFQEAVRRAREQLRSRGGPEDASQRLISLLEDLKTGDKPLERLLVKSGGRVFFLKVDEIDWIEAAGNYVRLHVGKDAYLVRETMNDLESKLDSARFLRIHRSTLVNLDRIKEMHPWFSGDYLVVLIDGTQLKLSRGYRDRVESHLGNSL